MGRQKNKPRKKKAHPSQVPDKFKVHKSTTPRIRATLTMWRRGTKLGHGERNPE